MFRCQATGGELTANDEVSEFRWVTAVEARSLLTEAYAVRVVDALRPADAAPPAVRLHDGTHLL